MLLQLCFITLAVRFKGNVIFDGRHFGSVFVHKEKFYIIRTQGQTIRSGEDSNGIRETERLLLTFQNLQCSGTEY